MKRNCCKGCLGAKGFTLIEFLVVVLIIGILAAIALPQYQKAVWKARAISYVPLGIALRNEEERYFLENGVFTSNPADLDIIWPSNCSVNKNNSSQMICSGVSYTLSTALQKRTGSVIIQPHKCPVRTPHSYYGSCLQLVFPFQHALLNYVYMPNKQSFCEPLISVCDAANTTCVSWANKMCQALTNNTESSARRSSTVYYFH